MADKPSRSALFCPSRSNLAALSRVIKCTIEAPKSITIHSFDSSTSALTRPNEVDSFLAFTSLRNDKEMLSPPKILANYNSHKITWLEWGRATEYTHFIDRHTKKLEHLDHLISRIMLPTFYRDKLVNLCKLMLAPAVPFTSSVSRRSLCGRPTEAGYSTSFVAFCV